MFAFIIGLVLLLWLVLSVLNQFSFSFMKRVSARFDRWLLIPRWTFFAPNPGCTDYRLVYRDFNEEEQPFSWNEVPLVRKREYRDALWNPDKRRSKALFDLVQSLMLLSQEYSNPSIIMTSLPYVALLHYVDRLPRPHGVRYRQFMVVQTHGIYTDSNPEVLMHSGIHSVCD